MSSEDDVLYRIRRRMPLNTKDHKDAVLSLIEKGIIHVTPYYDREDKCPYRITGEEDEVRQAP